MKFPFYKQLDGMDCGPSCLRMIARYHGKKFSVQQLREQSFIQRTGVNMQGISEAAASIGMRATGIRTTLEKTEATIQAALHSALESDTLRGALQNRSKERENLFLYCRSGLRLAEI